MHPKDLEAKKRHHYVWANYLARWGSGTKNVFYTTKTGKIAHDSMRGIAVDDYFYRTTILTPRHVEILRRVSKQSPDHLQAQHMSYLGDFLKAQSAEAAYRKSGLKSHEIELHIQALKCNLLENLHASHESTAQPVLAALADGRLEVLEDRQHMVGFMAFFGQQISRTKPFRDAALRANPRRNPIENEVADAMSHAWWFLSYMLGMNIGFSLYSSRNTATHALLINDTQVPFITSDQPIVNVHSCVSETTLTPPEHADFYYPLSPRFAYMICDSERFERGRNEIDEAVAIEMNTKLASQAMVHIIGGTREAIHPFQKHIGLRYQKLTDDMV